jgi:preprotein translocase subunit YajC
MPAILVLGVTFVLMWVLFILPQQKRIRAHHALVARLEIGDEVMTSSGLYGRIAVLDDEIASLEIAPGVVVRCARAAIARRLSEEAESAAPPARPSATAADRAAADSPESSDT